MTVTCPYCGGGAELVDGRELYSRDDLANRMFWLCRDCEAWTGTHRNSRDHKPLGRLANRELRKLRVRAHKLFDPLWRAKMRRDGVSKSKARKAAYRWLSNATGIPKQHCHIAMLDKPEVMRVIEVLDGWYNREKD